MIAASMKAHPACINYLKLVGPSTMNYAEAVISQYGVRLQPISDFGAGMTLTPMLRYMDNVSIVSVRYLRETVFMPASAVRAAPSSRIHLVSTRRCMSGYSRLHSPPSFRQTTAAFSSPTALPRR